MGTKSSKIVDAKTFLELDNKIHNDDNIRVIRVKPVEKNYLADSETKTKNKDIKETNSLVVKTVTTYGSMSNQPMD